MHSSQLLCSLQALEAPDLKRFEVYVNSSYFNQDDRIKRLLTAIMPYAPEFSSPDLAAPLVFAQLYPGERFQPGKLNKVSGKLHQLLKQFICELENDQRTYLVDALLFSQLRKQQISEVFQIWEAEKPRRRTGGKRIRRSYVADALHLSRKLQRTCEQLSSNYQVNPEAYRLLARSLNSYLAHQPQHFWELPVVRLYYQIFLLLTEPQHEAHLSHFITLIQDYKGVFSNEETVAAFQHPIRFCLKQIEAGKDEYQTRLFHLYEILISQEALLRDGRLDSSEYQQVIEAGMLAKEYTWTKAFIHRFRPHLSPKYRKDAFLYCLAYYYSETDQLTKASDLLQSQCFTSVRYELQARHLLFHLLMDNQDLESLNIQMEMFRSYLELNRELAPETQRRQLEFLSFLTRISRLIAGKDRMKADARLEELRRLERDIASKPTVIDHAWLQDQISRLRTGEIASSNR